MNASGQGGTITSGNRTITITGKVVVPSVQRCTEASMENPFVQVTASLRLFHGHLVCNLEGPASKAPSPAQGPLVL